MAESSSGQQGTNTENTNDKGPKPKAQHFRYPLKRIDSKSDYLEIKIAKYKAPGFLKKDSDKIKGLASIPTGTDVNRQTEALKTIYLPIPQNLSDTNSMTWGDDNINPLEAFGLKSATGSIQSLEEAQKMITEFISKVGSEMGNIDKKLLTSVIGGKLYNVLGGNVSLQSVISRATGQILNPNLELLFQGVNIRSFSFTFDFAPRDQREAREVKNIIRTLKESSSPRTKTGGNFGKVFIDSPNIFRLRFKTGNKEHPFLNRFKPMALTDMALNYTASGTYATYQDGTPVHMQMTLTFKELNPIYSEDYEGVGGVGY